MTGTFLRSAWYVIGCSNEITIAPTRRMFMDAAVVVYRGECGKVAALADACAHRFAPLSQGTVFGDTIQCPYHGLRYGMDGACVLRPHGDGRIPPTARVRSHAVVEQQGMVWIWGGEQDGADYAAVPHIPMLDDPAFAVVSGCMVVDANYQLVTDNLMDLSHVDYLHPLLRAAQHDDRNRHEVRREGQRVWSMLWRDHVKPSGLQAMLWDDGEYGNARAHMRWTMPSTLELDTGIAPPDKTPELGVSLPSIYFLTPETEARTRYYWMSGRNRRIDDEEMSERVRSLIEQAFSTEDKPVVEAQQRHIGSADIMELKPALLQPDAASVQVRRIMKRAIAAEQGLS